MGIAIDRGMGGTITQMIADGLITGAAGGVGLATARLCAGLGAELIHSSPRSTCVRRSSSMLIMVLPK